MIVTRFAPSPTGRLHVGNLRAALHNWLAARQGSGRFLLRIDDTDRARSDERYVEAILADLDWLGLTPDAVVRQSERFDRYQARFDALVEAGRIYPCWETPEELELKRKVRLGRGLPPIYDRAALSLGDDEKAALLADRPPHWRFRLDEGALEWDDLVRGPQRFVGAELSDPVIRRADGSWLYMFPSVVDDIELGVTHVVRGEDHVSNTAVQLGMWAAMGAEPPRFAHLALLVGGEGKLSKRLGSADSDSFRADGIEPLALAALLAHLGTSRPVEPVASLHDLAADFDFAMFGRAPARFDDAELQAVNARTVHGLAYEQVAGRLPDAIDPPAWAVIRGNLASVGEAADWVPVLSGAIDAPDLADDDRAYLGDAAAEAASVDWTADPWHALTAALRAHTGRKGRALFLPLRLALTGRGDGPDMAALLPLIGRDRALDRLRAAARLA